MNFHSKVALLILAVVPEPGSYGIPVCNPLQLFRLEMKLLQIERKLKTGLL